MLVAVSTVALLSATARSAAEAKLLQVRPDMLTDLSDHETCYIGGPVWPGHMNFCKILSAQS